MKYKCKLTCRGGLVAGGKEFLKELVYLLDDEDERLG